ncbi:MAG: glycosyltransferase [Bacteroidales bacterium]|nr:glycosyltransferase [Bacteroidales bacterium]
MLQESNKIVHGLWIGKHLSPVELLCIHSFIAQGHEFHLWLYDKLETALPLETIIEDASQIIPASAIFSYSSTNQFGHGKGSYAGFSDIFRYRLLYEKGGWWTDMDVICLKTLDFSEPYLFRTHHNFPVVGNIMKCPEKSHLMLDCYNESLATVKANNTDWHLPIAILNNHIEKQNLNHFIKEISNPDRWLFVKLLITFQYKVNKNWYVVHLMNEEWRKNKINKNAIPDWSFIGNLLLKHNITRKKSFLKNIKNLIRLML